MANVDAAFGFRPVRHMFGGVVRPSEYRIAGEYGTALYRGDPVKSVGTGRTVEIAVTSTNALGIFDGCQYVNAQGEIVFSPYWPASQTIKAGSEVRAFVYDDPNILFEVQADGLVAAADIGHTADWASGTGSALTGQSKYELESAGIASDAGLKIVDIVRDGVNAFGANARVLVLINEHEHRPGTFTGV